MKQTTTNKRDFRRFVVHKHDTSRLHYDIRFEFGGLLKSWALPKGPSMNPADKRLAVAVEDHPLKYGKFEGVLPESSQGAGTVLLWDEGVYYLPSGGEKEVTDGLKQGKLTLELRGKKLRGEFTLIRLERSDEENAWLLIKNRDPYALHDDILKLDRSVLSGKTLEEIANQPRSNRQIASSGYQRYRRKFR